MILWQFLTGSVTSSLFVLFVKLSVFYALLSALLPGQHPHSLSDTAYPETKVQVGRKKPDYNHIFVRVMRADDEIKDEKGTGK